MSHINGTVKEEDILFVTMSRATETKDLHGRMIFVNKGRYLLQRGRSNIYVLWSCCEYCNSDLDPDWNEQDWVFTCSICGAPV